MNINNSRPRDQTREARLLESVDDIEELLKLDQEDFKMFALENGVAIIGDPVPSTPSGRFTRRYFRCPCAYSNHSRSDDAGWYTFHLSVDPEIPSFGSCGCWRCSGDQSFRWVSNRNRGGRKTLSRAIKQKMKAIEKEMAEELHNQHCKTAQALYRSFIKLERAETNYPHPYLTRKKCKAWGLRIAPIPPGQKFGQLIMPLRDEDYVMWSCQMLLPEPFKGAHGKTFSKLNLKGGRISGCYHNLGRDWRPNDEHLVILAEGYATGASIHENTDGAVPVLVCAGVNNIYTVARKIFKIRENIRIYIAVDLDSASMKCLDTLMYDVDAFGLVPPPCTWSQPALNSWAESLNPVFNFNQLGMSTPAERRNMGNNNHATPIGVIPNTIGEVPLVPSTPGDGVFNPSPDDWEHRLAWLTTLCNNREAERKSGSAQGRPDPGLPRYQRLQAALKTKPPAGLTNPLACPHWSNDWPGELKDWNDLSQISPQSARTALRDAIYWEHQFRTAAYDETPLPKLPASLIVSRNQLDYIQAESSTRVPS